ncbi:MAG: hypothetical protein HYU77_02115 [Betaproteobacteria bacterium]|nr:hypothetical protein [Betaproteobacteria bacterium]
MAKPNYQYEKRQKELAKKKKQEEKRLRKTGKGDAQPQENPDQPPDQAETKSLAG